MIARRLHIPVKQMKIDRGALIYTQRMLGKNAKAFQRKAFAFLEEEFFLIPETCQINIMPQTLYLHPLYAR